MTTTPTVEPLQATAGATWTWRREDLTSDYPAGSSWVLTYYFTSVFSQLDRAVGLLGLGLLFLAGGWGLERLRRRLLAAPRP